MSKHAIHQYYNRLDQYKRFGGTRNESSIRRAFANLLEEYCLPKHLVLVDELHLQGLAETTGRHGQKRQSIGLGTLGKQGFQRRAGRAHSG